MRQLVLFNFSLTPQHISRFCGLRFSGTGCVLLKIPSTLTPRVSDFVFAFVSASQPITQTTRSKLDSAVRELVAYRSTSAAERDDVASAAHFLELCCRVLLGAI